MNHRPWQEIVHQLQSHRGRTISQVQPPIPDVLSPLPRNVPGTPQTLLSLREDKTTTTYAEDLVVSFVTSTVRPSIYVLSLPITMDRFSVAQDVANMLPNMQVAAYILNNNGKNAQLAKFAEVTMSRLEKITQSNN